LFCSGHYWLPVTPRSSPGLQKHLCTAAVPIVYVHFCHKARKEEEEEEEEDKKKKKEEEKKKKKKKKKEEA
jgi:hypothetical protein